MTPRMMKTTKVSIPRKPSGLMKREGKTIFSPSSMVLSSRFHAHLRRAMIGSRKPWPLDLGAANARLSVEFFRYDAVVRAQPKSNPRKGPQSQNLSRTLYRDRIFEPVLASMTRTKKPVLIIITARVDDAS